MTTPEDVLGHRLRLRQKILTLPFSSLADYEVLEALLTFAIPRKDVKPLAKALIKRFGTLGNVLSAAPSELITVAGCKEATATLLRAIHLAQLHALNKEISKESIVEKWQELLNYYHVQIAREKRETFHVVFLNAKAVVISDEEIARGTINETPIYPREIIARALALGAVYLILIHNHPSGSFYPSQNDEVFTRELMETCKGVCLRLFDHIIISTQGSFSFREHHFPPFDK